jgi:alkylated DNA nucleotide flippase Atl1
VAAPDALYFHQSRPPVHGLASTARRRDWADLHAILTAIPADRWTTYGELATAVGSHAVPVGQHLASCPDCTGGWRVLTSRGTVSSGFRWSDPARTDTAEDVLRRDGVRIVDGTADPSQKLTADALANLPR